MISRRLGKKSSFSRDPEKYSINHYYYSMIEAKVDSSGSFKSFDLWPVAAISFYLSFPLLVCVNE